jgi:putative ABC transport system permease protein
MNRNLHVILSLFATSSRLQRKRAVLTVASIAWGTVAILLLLAFGEGLKRQMDKNRRSTGENIAVMWMGETSKPWKGMPPGRPVRLRIDDLDLVRARMPELKSVVGEVVSWRTNLTYGRKTVNGRVIGTNVPYGEARKHYPVAGGRFISPEDEVQRRRVAFLGDEMAKDIYGDEKPIGKLLLINNAPYTVIGVMQHKTQMGMYGGPDSNHAIVPISTFRAQFGRDRLNNLLIETEQPEQMKSELKRLNEIVGAKYGYDPSDDRALPAWDMVKSSQTTKKILVGLQLFLGIVGALTLLIGGVGVANIMYAVVKERTREIGVKMALGAKQRWILSQFLMETMIVTFIGGAIGFAISIGVCAVFPKLGLTEYVGDPVVSPTVTLLTAVALGIVGLLAGYFPAREAAQLDPVVAMKL